MLPRGLSHPDNSYSPIFRWLSLRIIPDNEEYYLFLFSFLGVEAPKASWSLAPIPTDLLTKAPQGQQ